MAALKEKAITLLGSASVDMKNAGSTTIFTVPVGKVCRVIEAIVRDPTASLAGGTSYTITGLRSAFSLNGSTTANTGVTVVRAADLVEQIEQAAGTAIQVTVTTGSTAACTATVDIFGYLT